MLGTIADGKISFKCLGGLAVIRIASMPVAEGTLAVTADQQLSGDFTVSNLSSTTTPEITTTTGSDDNKKVSFTFNNATKDGVGVFYLPLAVGSYTNVKIEIKDKSTNTWWMSNNSTLTINRAGVTAVPLASTDMGKIVKNTDGTYTINSQYTFRDLGLSVLWATMNVGATTETGYGDFYSWGETDTKDSFSSPSTYADNPTTLPADHDAATANWGSACRMPTNTEFGELTNNCDWSWTTESSINGCKVTCKKQGSTNNSIFLPAAGLKYSSSTIGQGSYGDYLSSSLSDESDCAYYATFDSTGCKNGNKGKRWLGYTVRAVADKPTILE